MRKELIWKDWKVDLKARQPHIPVKRTLKQGTLLQCYGSSFDASLLAFWYLGPRPEMSPASASWLQPQSAVTAG